MARGPFSPTNNFFTSSVITSYPFTFSAWFNTSNNTISSGLVNTTELPSGDWIDLGIIPGGIVRASSTDFGVDSDGAVSSSGAGNDEWHNACGVFAASDDRAAYLDGSSKGTTSVNIAANIGGMDEIQIGWFRAIGTGPSPHVIAEVGVWDVALTDEEIAVLGKGFSCHYIRPQNLIHHMPLVRRSLDLQGDLTEAGTVLVADHPPIIGAIAV